MAPPLQTLTIITSNSILLRLVVLAASMLAVRVSGGAGATAAEGPPPSGYISLPLMRRPASAALAYSGGAYLMKFKHGGSLVSGIMDTGSDLIWTNSSQLVDSATSFPCGDDDSTTTKGSRSNCELEYSSSAGWDVSSSGSSSCAKDMNKEYYCCGGDCMFSISYADGSNARGFMASASLTFQEEVKATTMFVGSAVTLGCKHSAAQQDAAITNKCLMYGDGGIVGLGRGKLSLVQQLQLLGFSYLLTTDDKTSSQIVFYMTPESLPPTPGQDGSWKSTPLVDVQTDGTETSSRYYYVKLQGISIGGKAVEDIPDKSMMIIDSGSTFTRLPREVFVKVRNAVQEAMEKHMNKKPKPRPSNKNWSCYDYSEGTQLPPNSLPDMVLRLGDDVEMILPVANYMSVDHANKEVCLAMKEARDIDYLPDTFILGNFQQQNIHMLFNIRDKKLSFMPPKRSGGNMHAAV